MVFLSCLKVWACYVVGRQTCNPMRIFANAIAVAVLVCLPALGQVVVVPGDHSTPPPMPDLLPQGGWGLNANEYGAAEAMVREFENYAAQENEPALLERAP